MTSSQTTNYFLVTAVIISSVTSLTKVQTSCGSANGPNLSYEQLWDCLNKFCLCNRFDNCSRLSPIEDVMVMLMNRHNGVVMCSGLLGKMNEPNGTAMPWVTESHYPDKHQFLVIKETDEMLRIVFSFTDQRGETFVKTMKGKKFPVTFNNMFHGMHMNTSGLLSGKLLYWNKRQSLPTFADYENDYFDPFYFMFRWRLKRKDRFADRPTIESSTELIGPTGPKALKGQHIRYLGVLSPVADISSLMDITFDINYVIPQNDLIVFRSLDLEISSGEDFDLSICIGKTVNHNTGLAYWTSEGCRPVLDYVHQEMHPSRNRGYGPYFSTKIRCECQWPTKGSEPAPTKKFPKNGAKSDRRGIVGFALVIIMIMASG